MKKINVCGNIFSSDGYSIHTTNLAKCLKNVGYDVGIESNKPQGWESQVPDWLRECLDNDYKFETTIYVGLPNFWPLELSERPKDFYGFFVWESKDIPACYKMIMNDERIKGIFVPSTYLKKVVEEFCNRPVFVVPHGVDAEVFKPEETKKEKFTFLFHKGWSKGVNDRSGFDILLKAFAEEFKKDEPVQLVAKIVTVYNPPGWSINEEIRKLNVELKDNAEIKIMLDLMPYKELYKFYNQGDVFVLPSKGEGFGLTAIEAMACKLPVIATGFGGHTDFVNQDNGWLVDYNFAPATDGFLTEECRWAIPQVESLKKALRQAFESRNTKEFEIKKRLAFETTKNFSWEHTAKKIKEIIGE